MEAHKYINYILLKSSFGRYFQN